MSTTAIGALLQSALLLLTMAQSTPDLPQGFQTNAVSVAEQAIAEATAALSASSTNSVVPTPSTTNQTFTTPSGAVIAPGGNVLSVPASVAPAATTDTPALSVAMVPVGMSGASLSQDLPWLDEEIWMGQLSFPAAIQLTASTTEDVYIISLPAILSASNGAKITDLYYCDLGGTIDGQSVSATTRINPSQSGTVGDYTLSGGMEVQRGRSVQVGVSCYIGHGVSDSNGMAFSLSSPPVVGGTYTLSLDPNASDYDAVGNTSGKQALITVENNASSSITVQKRT